MKATKKTKRMSPDLFLSLFPKDGNMRSIDEIILILDAGVYWDNREDYTPKQKRSHVKRRMEKLKTHNGSGYPLFISWPAPFTPTLYQLNLDHYNRHMLGQDDEESAVATDNWPNVVGDDWPEILDGE
jgi:hypothetical protein